MKLWRNNRISTKQHEILLFIYQYRHLTNEHLRRLLYRHLKSKTDGQKANVSRYIAGLKKMKFIESKSCYPFSKELIHFLTSKGVQYVKEHVIIDADHEEAGFDMTHFGDFDTQTLKVKFKNIEHTMMCLDYTVDNRWLLNFRHNLYAAKEYLYYDRESTEYKKSKIRPDAEAAPKDNSGRVFAIEIDTGSERFADLVLKFRNYKRYLDHCIENDLEFPWTGILFVRKNDNLEFLKDRRLHTILRAVIEGLEYYCWDFVFIFYSNRIPEFLNELLLSNDERLGHINLPVPSRTNTAVVEKEKRVEEERRKEEEQREIQERARTWVEEQSRKERLKYEKRLRQEELQRKSVEKNKKRFWKRISH